MATYHPGELWVQEQAGSRRMADLVGGMVDPGLGASGRAFLERQPLLAVSTLDAAGQPWASLWLGAPGFVRADAAGTTVEVDLGAVARTPGDPSVAHLRPGRDVALLAIDLSSARRLRVNGAVESVSPERARIRIREAYPNCPKYIRRRRLVSMTPTAPGWSTSGDALGPDQRARWAAAETFFVASRHPERGADASHRGGPPGFVTVRGNTLVVPDFGGNGMFQTLGNLVVDDRAGAVVLDFATGRSLQVVGRARVRIEAQGARRWWELDVERWLDAPLGVALEWAD